MKCGVFVWWKPAQPLYMMRPGFVASWGSTCVKMLRGKARSRACRWYDHKNLRSKPCSLCLFLPSASVTVAKETSWVAGTSTKAFSWSELSLPVLPVGKGLQYSHIPCPTLFLWTLFFFFNNLCLIAKVIHVHWKISLILKFINHAWFEVKLENDCFLSNPNFWRLASKQSLELCNSQFSRKTFPKGQLLF